MRLEGRFTIEIPEGNARKREFWTLARFKRVLGRSRLKREMSGSDSFIASHMGLMQGGRWWPTTDGGLVRLPDDRLPYELEAWMEKP